MCGLAAIFSYGPRVSQVDEEELLSIRDSMLNRGPDDSGLWLSRDKRIGLAHRRLSIIDLTDSASQPMSDKSNRIKIVFNGEIYNFRELSRDLKSKGYSFKTSSDTEVLIYLYMEHGTNMVHYLRGMYAFAIWDELNNGLFLARDPFGIKPLYYADNGETIRVASQVRALLKSSSIDTSEEPAGHVGFFLWGHVPEPFTLYRGIRSLPAGTALWIDAEGRKENKIFFRLAEEMYAKNEIDKPISPDELRESLREALLDTMSHHLISDVPVGVFLSAGIDSTTLATLAQEVGIDELRTITLGFKEFQDTENDEVPLAELVSRKLKSKHRTQWVSQSNFHDENQRLFEAMDQPSLDGINSYFVSKAAADAGLKVAISGMGGDELFGGYPSFTQIPKLVNGLNLFNKIPEVGRGFRYFSAPILKYFTSPKYAGLLEYGGTYSGSYLLRRGLYMPWELPEFLDGEMVREGWNDLNTLANLNTTHSGLTDSRLIVSSLETSWYMRNQLLRDIDWASMSHSLEVRTPFVDVQLYRAVSRLVNNGCTPGKSNMAMSPYCALPDEILNRRKTGFSIPVHRWLMDDEKYQQGRGYRGWSHHVYKSVLGRIN
ncbi:MAG: asparagine synthase (glutamine-hydrolyzing) [Porticoccaceae bacterium]|nr:asparagine synthase (glutamine-hydrolyzing) [Porticoccaceae bacterium]|tara:strand:- start:9077 stop:10882 length:1806 start_codon:yes stop_codon:yes gene_type:complete